LLLIINKLNIFPQRQKIQTGGPRMVQAWTEKEAVSKNTYYQAVKKKDPAGFNR
jgi:hypothetical protein